MIYIIMKKIRYFQLIKKMMCYNKKIKFNNYCINNNYLQIYIKFI